VRDFAIVSNAEVIDKKVADIALKRLDVDENGLDSMDRKYLKCILDFYNGGPVGVETLAAVLSEKRDTIEEVVEPYILQKGLVQRPARGRVLTTEGYRYLGAAVPNKNGDLYEGDLL
jgi:Holliday junction DNA helicase RuvB